MCCRSEQFQCCYRALRSSAHQNKRPKHRSTNMEADQIIKLLLFFYVMKHRIVSGIVWQKRISLVQMIHHLLACTLFPHGTNDETFRLNSCSIKILGLVNARLFDCNFQVGKFVFPSFQHSHVPPKWFLGCDQVGTVTTFQLLSLVIGAFNIEHVTQY